ncbi:MAG: PHP domain-containing protein [Coriobacteriia bacterium]|nr:PHP domain-containing protein [Coriobacteriia bacterium]
MRLKADLHTHTVASGHAFSTVTEIATVAARYGLELFAITDHGPLVPQGAHPWYFLNLKNLPSILGGVRILKGCEANLSESSENGIDLPDEVLEALDFVSVGFHPLIGFDDHDRCRNTEALLRAMESPYVDQVVHPGNERDFPLHMDRIAEAAARYQVILELNNHSFNPSSMRSNDQSKEREFARAAAEAKAPIAIGSDAHYALHVGHFTHAEHVAEELGIDEGCVVNRDAESVLGFLGAKRKRPFLDHGGSWELGGA